MAAVFQPNVFQNNVFQVNGAQPVPAPVEQYAVGGGSGKSVDLDELDTFKELKRLMDGGKSLKDALSVLDVEEKKEITVPRKITPKMQKRAGNPTVLAWINQRIVTLERAIFIQREDEDEEEAIVNLLGYLA